MVGVLIITTLQRKNPLKRGRESRTGDWRRAILFQITQSNNASSAKEFLPVRRRIISPPVLLTESGERLDHGRLVVPDGLDGGEVVVEEVDAVPLEESVGPRRLPPRDLDGGVRHAHQAHVARRARG